MVLLTSNLCASNDVTDTVDKIKNYAKNGNHAPQLLDYNKIGIVGVDKENLDAINEKIKRYNFQNLNTKEKIQKAVDAYHQMILACMNIITNYILSSSDFKKNTLPQVDTTKPTITLKGDASITLTQGTVYTDEGATATDDRDGDISSAIVIHNPVDTHTVGLYAITYDVKDNAGNQATQITRTVKISLPKDTTKPVITLNGDASITLMQGTAYTDEGVTAIDDRDGNISSSITVHNSVDINKLGDYTITYDVKDSAGNQATQITRTVSIIEKTLAKLKAELDVLVEGDDINATQKAYEAYNFKTLLNTYEKDFGTEPIEVIKLSKTHPELIKAFAANTFNPNIMHNLESFITDWKKEGKDDELIEKYLNVAFGLSVNAGSSGIHDKISFSYSSQHDVFDYAVVKDMDANIEYFKENSTFFPRVLELNRYPERFKYTYNITGRMEEKYNLSYGERRSMVSWSYFNDYLLINELLKEGIAPESLSLAQRREKKITFDQVNAFLKINNKTPLSWDDPKSPKQAALEYIDANDLTIPDYLMGFSDSDTVKKYRETHLESDTYEQRDGLGEAFGLRPADYKLMSFYELANLHIKLDQIPAKTFDDGKISWPLLKGGVDQEPWHHFALEQSAEKRECEYVAERFFEEDRQKRIDSYPPNSVDESDNFKAQRFITHVEYTKENRKKERKYAKSTWEASKSIYRILQDGGICVRQSILGQHTRNCLGVPAIGRAEPGHRAYAYIANVGNTKYYTEESDQGIFGNMYSDSTINPPYNEFANTVRKDGGEKFAGAIAATVSGDNGFEETLTDALVLERMAVYNPAHAEKYLLEAIKKAPEHTELWYHLAKVYAAQEGAIEKITNLANTYLAKREINRLEPSDAVEDSNNYEVVTAINIMLVARESRASTPDILTAILAFSDDLQTVRRDMLTYRALFDLYRKAFLENNDTDAFLSGTEKLFADFIDNHEEGINSVDADEFLSISPQEYWSGKDINTTATIDKLVDYIFKSTTLSSGFRNDLTSSKFFDRGDAYGYSIELASQCFADDHSLCPEIFAYRTTLDSNSSHLLHDNYMPDAIHSGEEGVSKFTIDVMDDDNNSAKMVVSGAKYNDVGSFFKLNDRTESVRNRTRMYFWIETEDNPDLIAGKKYSSIENTIFSVYMQSEYSMIYEEKIPFRVKDVEWITNLNERNITGGNMFSFEPSEATLGGALYFTSDLDRTLYSDYGGFSWKDDSEANVPVVGDDGEEYSLHIRLRRKLTSDLNCKINKMRKSRSSQSITIEARKEDNPSLPVGVKFTAKSSFALYERLYAYRDTQTNNPTVGRINVFIKDVLFE